MPLRPFLSGIVCCLSPLDQELLHRVLTRHVFRAGGVDMATPPAWLSQARR
jgi:hypothetical protein